MNVPLHIIHVYKTYYSASFGGAEQFIRQLGMRHVGMGHKVSVLTLCRHIAAPKCEQHDGITVWYYPLTMEIASNGMSLSAMRHYRALAATADILHYHFPWPSGDILHQLAPKRVPALVTYHADIVRQKWLKRVYAPLMHVFLGQMRAIVATSPNYLATSPVLQHYLAKTEVIPIGLQRSSYPVPAPEQIAGWREKYGDRFFLFVGALRYYKDLHTLIEAGRLTGLPVVIAGAGGEEETLRQAAQGIPNIHFTGLVNDEDKMALLQLCCGFVFPSHVRSEAFGISLLEAAMVGKPLISCEIGSGMSYINRDGETGLVVAPQDAAAFGAAMQTIAEDSALEKRLGAAARARFEALFTADKMAMDYAALYKRLQYAAPKLIPE